MCHLDCQYVSVFHSLSDEWRLVIIRRDPYTVYPSLCLSELIASGSVAAKLWDQYIRPPSHPMFVLLNAWIFICPILRVCVSTLVSENLWVCLDIAAYLWFCESVAGRGSVDTDKSKALTSPNASFPSSASSRQWLQIITSLFFCPLFSRSSYSALPKCCCSSMWD